MLVDRINEWAKHQPAKIAVVWNDRSLSYLSYSNAIQSAYYFLRRENLPAGRTAIVLVGSLLNAWVIILALRALGLNTISVNSMRQAESLRVRDVACIVVAQTEVVATNLAVGPFVGAKIVSIPASVFVGNDNELLSVLHDNRPFGGHILYTSGTTGTYKKIMMLGEHEEQRNRARMQLLHLNSDTVFHGLNFGLWTGVGFKTPPAIWNAGGCVILDQRDDCFRNFFSYQITFAQFIPAMLKELIDARGPSASPINRFAAVVGGAPLPIETAEQCIRHLTDNLTIYYPSTELINIPLQTRFRSVDDLHWLVPTDERLVQIVDENDKECAIGQEGELRVLLLDIDCHEYLDDEEATARTFRNGFFYPGDMAVKREDGRIRILGRTADVVILNGQKVATAPIEQAIQRYLSVEEVCLFSGLTMQGHEEVIVAIQSDKRFARAQFEAAAREFIPTSRVRFSVWRQFPRTDTGTRKTKRRLLKKLLFEEINND